ncbi:MAG: MBL fold metallo-hydrolase [Dehalococcoidia bacterium]|nr:MBL fold metallo-hydrolase [Dehalococcoidia bacterium]
MEKLVDGDLGIVRAGPAGFGNNIYIVIDEASGEAAFIDAPDEVEKSIAAVEFAGVEPSTILLTHSHQDHTASIVALKERYGCRLIADPEEPWIPEGTLDEAITDGDTVKVGGLTFDVVSIPGHTPASTAFIHGSHAFVGDTLFPGGPGHSRSNELLQQEIASITTRLYALADETTVWPGHGGNTTIGASKAEYEVFASRDHAPDLHGDVLWLES